MDPEARATVRGMKAPLFAFVTLVALTGLVGATAPAGRAGADQVGSLSAQAKKIAQELVQEQLEVGAYQQQYSVASARVADDERAIASTQTQLRGDRLEIDKRLDVVRRLAIETYVVNGTVSSASGAGVFAENVNTAQTANEYAVIAEGDLAKDVDELHTAQRNEQGQQQLLIRQKNQDLTVQNQEASYLTQANASREPAAVAAVSGDRPTGDGGGAAGCRTGTCRRRGGGRCATHGDPENQHHHGTGRVHVDLDGTGPGDAIGTGPARRRRSGRPGPPAVPPVRGAGGVGW